MRELTLCCFHRRKIMDELSSDDCVLAAISERDAAAPWEHTATRTGLAQVRRRPLPIADAEQPSALCLKTQPCSGPPQPQAGDAHASPRKAKLAERQLHPSLELGGLVAVGPSGLAWPSPRHSCAALHLEEVDDARPPGGPVL